MAAFSMPLAISAGRGTRIAIIVALCTPCMAAHAHSLSAATAETPSFGWQFPFWITTLLAVSLVLYIAGFVRLERRGAAGRVVRRAYAAAFAAGWLALALVLVSPLDALSGALFSAHMVEHEAMMLICAPLMVLGRPLGIMLWALPHAQRLALGRALHTRAWTACWRRLASPMWAWSLHAAALWAWHAPVLFEAAVAHPLVHTMQHASFLFTALLFWRGIVGEGATRQGGGNAMLSLFTTMVHTGALGALITLAPGIWYVSYIEPASALGLDPLHDQQLGGLIMWIPGALAYLAGALMVAARWLREGPRPSRRYGWPPHGETGPVLKEQSR